MTARNFLRSGTSLTKSVNGDSATVECLVPAGDVSGSDLQRLDLATLRPDIPQYLEGAPGYPGLTAHTITARADGRHVRLTITYGPPNVINTPPDDNDEGTIEVGSTMVTVRTMRAADGTPFVVSYTYHDADNPYSGQTIEQVAEAEDRVPHTTIRVTRRVKTSPLGKSIAFTGAVNQFEYRGLPARTLIVTEISGTSTDGGDSYVERTELVYRPETWDQTLTYKDNLTANGGVPADVFDPVLQPGAVLVVQPPRVLSFASLGLPDFT